MKIIFYLIISLTMAIVSANATLAKEWRGIIPLRSTRADVERLLGAPKQNTPDASYYSLPDEIVVVWFQSESCDTDLGKFGIGWNVPAGTVTNIGVIPKANYQKEKFLTEGKYKTQDANAGIFYYTDDSEGLSVETFNGVVTCLDYTPTEKEDNRRCPRVQKCCAHPRPLFDEYRNLSFADERARLDNYASVMRERMNRGVIIVYGKNRAERSKVMKRAERAKNYLMQKHGIESQRILIVDGGYREDSVTQLNLHTIGGVANNIYLFPEIDPEERSQKRK